MGIRVKERFEGVDDDECFTPLTGANQASGDR